MPYIEEQDQEINIEGSNTDQPNTLTAPTKSSNSTVVGDNSTEDTTKQNNVTNYSGFTVQNTSYSQDFTTIENQMEEYLGDEDEDNNTMMVTKAAATSILPSYSSTRATDDTET